MAKEDIIFAIEHCLLSDSTICEGCYQDGPGFLGITCKRNVIRDALTLLKKQPEIVRCKDCKHWDKTTREAGNDCISGPWEDAVCEVFRDWDSYGELGEHFWRTNGDWFCADGERR